MKNEKNYVDVVVLVRNVWIKIRKITGHPMALKKENINNNLEVGLEAVEAIEVVAKILIRIATVRNQPNTNMRIMKKSKRHPHHPLEIGLMSSQMPPLSM